MVAARVEEVAVRVDAERPGALLCWRMASGGEQASGGVDGEDGNAIVAAIGDVDGSSRRVNPTVAVLLTPSNPSSGRVDRD